MIFRKSLALLLLLMLLPACDLLGGQSTAIPVPSTTPTGALVPSDTPPAPTDTAPAPTAEPTVTPPAVLPEEAILLLEPGLVSAVTSPVHVSGEANPTFEQTIVIQVSGEDGTVLATAPTQIQADIGQRGPFSADVSFSVAADQPGRISVYSASARDGGLEHLSSVEVTLLAGGTATINLAQPHPETITIYEPAPLAVVSGGVAHITGFSEYVFEGNLVIVICGEGGSGAPDLFCGTLDNVLASATTIMDAPDIGQPGPFTVDVPYTVSASVHGRIAVYNASPRDGGLLHLSSVNVTLEP